MRSSQPGLSGARVLIVGDDASVTDRVSRVLRLAGCAVWAAPSLDLGLAHARAHTPDVLLIDVRSPLAISLSFARELRTLPGFASRPVAIVTGDLRYRPAPDEVPHAVDVHYRPLWVDDLVALATGLLTVPVRT